MTPKLRCLNVWCQKHFSKVCFKGFGNFFKEYIKFYFGNWFFFLLVKTFYFDPFRIIYLVFQLLIRQTLKKISIILKLAFVIDSTKHLWFF